MFTLNAILRRNAWREVNAEYNRKRLDLEEHMKEAEEVFKLDTTQLRVLRDLLDNPSSWTDGVTCASLTEQVITRKARSMVFLSALVQTRKALDTVDSVQTQYQRNFQRSNDAARAQIVDLCKWLNDILLAMCERFTHMREQPLGEFPRIERESKVVISRLRSKMRRHPKLTALLTSAAAVGVGAACFLVTSWWAVAAGLVPLAVWMYYKSDRGEVSFDEKVSDELEKLRLRWARGAARGDTAMLMIRQLKCITAYTREIINVYRGDAQEVAFRDGSEADAPKPDSSPARPSGVSGEASSGGSGADEAAAAAAVGDGIDVELRVAVPRPVRVLNEAIITNNGSCSICFEHFTNTDKRPVMFDNAACRHSLCEKCFHMYATHKKQCHMCKKPFQHGVMLPFEEMDGVVSPEPSPVACGAH